MKPLAELKLTLSEFAFRCRTSRWFGPLFWQRQLHDITADLSIEHSVAAREAYSAEQEDIEARKELEAARIDLDEAIKDGLDDSDAPRVRSAMNRLRCAMANVDRSAERDRSISEILQPTT